MTRYLAPLISLAAILTATGAVAAQDRPAATPSLLSQVSGAGAALRAGAWAYDVIIRVEGEEQRVGTRLVLLDSATVDGRAAWRLVEISRMGGSEMIDSLVVDRATLAPLRRSLRMGGADLTLRFQGDSVMGTLGRAVGASTFAARYAGDAFVNGVALELALRLQTLGPGWMREVRQLVIGSGGRITTAAAELHVTGAEAVTVPAGRFESWVVRVASDGAEQRLWIDKETGTVLRTLGGAGQVAGAMVDVVLTRQELSP